MSCSKSCRPSFPRHMGKTRTTLVEYPIEMDLQGLLVFEKSGQGLNQNGTAAVKLVGQAKLIPPLPVLSFTCPLGHQSGPTTAVICLHSCMKEHPRCFNMQDNPRSSFPGVERLNISSNSLTWEAQNSKSTRPCPSKYRNRKLRQKASWPSPHPQCGPERASVTTEITLLKW